MKKFQGFLQLAPDDFQDKLGNTSKKEANEFHRYIQIELRSLDTKLNLLKKDQLKENEQQKREKMIEESEILQKELDHISDCLFKLAEHFDLHGHRDLSFQLIFIPVLKDFFQRIFTIDSNALLEIRPDLSLIIKSYTASRTAIKVIQIPMNEIFEIDEDDEDIKYLKSLPNSIKIGIYNLEKLIKFLSMDVLNDCVMKIQYALDSDGDNYAARLIFQTKLMTKDFACANKTLFKFMSDETADGVYNVDKFLFSFPIDKVAIAEIIAIAALEPASELTFKLTQDDENDEVHLDFMGKSYVIKHCEDLNVNEIDNPSISKDYMKYLDKDEYECFITGPSVIFFNKQPKTKNSDTEQKVIPICRIALGRLPDEEEEEDSDED